MDLSQLNNNDILLNNERKEIILTLPQPEVYSINVDESKTKYSAPELGFLRFGDIQLTSEEYGNVRAEILTAFENKMKDDSLHKQVITNATLSLENLITDLTGENYKINIKLKTS